MTHHATILSIASSVPGEAYSTEKMLESVAACLTDELSETLQGLGVSQRHSVVEDYNFFLAGKKDRKLIATTTSMATEAAKKCLNKFNQTVDIGLLISSTNTPDRLLPCLGSELISSLKGYIPQDINIANMQGEGCAALLKGVDIAKNYLVAHPDKQVLLITSESNTGYVPKMNAELHYSFKELKSMPQYGDKIKQTLQIITYFLFGDGAVAFLLGKGTVDQPHFEAITHLTNLEPEDSELLTMNEGGIVQPDFIGFPNYFMGRKVPLKGANYSKITVNQLMQKTKHSITEPHQAGICFIHTGSKKILDHVCEALKLSPSAPQVSHSYNILNRYGNLSSCAVGFMIEEYLSQKKPLGDAKLGLIVSFGVGFSASSGIMQG